MQPINYSPIFPWWRRGSLCRCCCRCGRRWVFCWRFNRRSQCDNWSRRSGSGSWSPVSVPERIVGSTTATWTPPGERWTPSSWSRFPRGRCCCCRRRCGWLCIVVIVVIVIIVIIVIVVVESSRGFCCGSCSRRCSWSPGSVSSSPETTSSQRPLRSTRTSSTNLLTSSFSILQ